MRVLVTGASGQLGQALARTAASSIVMTGVDRDEFDITDGGAVLQFCRAKDPDVIVNAAAYTAVDRAESEPELAAAVNEAGARNVAAAARAVSARMIQLSTDFVFDGEAGEPYPPDAATNPVSVYGRTKRDGELAVLDELPGSSVVLRTSWLYSKTGSNFVRTMLRLMGERDEIGVVADQVGTPTWANSLSKAVWAFVDQPRLSGIYHWSDAGLCSWYEFALAIEGEARELGLLEKAARVRAISSAEYPAAARRPRFSVLDCASTEDALNLQPERWRFNLRAMLKELVH